MAINLCVWTVGAESGLAKMNRLPASPSDVEGWSASPTRLLANLGMSRRSVDQGGDGVSCPHCLVVYRTAPVIKILWVQERTVAKESGNTTFLHRFPVVDWSTPAASRIGIVRDSLDFSSNFYKCARILLLKPHPVYYLFR